MNRPTEATASRGQTNLDFGIGIVVFLIGLSFVIGTVPQFLAPYDGQETPLVAERVSVTIADSLLAVTGEPGVLDANCTEAFFLGSGGGGCPFNPGDPLSQRVGVSSWYQMNVTLEWNVTGGPEREVLCFNGGTVGACGTEPLATGMTVPRGSQSVAVERRLVVLDGQTAVLEVRVW